MDMNTRADVRHDTDVSLLAARDPRAEAQRVVGDDFAARVLEPSPPAVVDDEWFADDPVAVDAETAVPVVSPVAGGAVTWDAWVREHPEHAPWAAARWLGAYRRLPRPPATLAETRVSLQRLAVYVVSPARCRANGKIALRSTLGGIGTPFFGADEQVRVVGTHLVRQRSGTAAAEPITTLTRAAGFVLDGPPDAEWAEQFDVPAPGDVHGELPVDPTAAAFLGDWYGFVYSALEELRAEPETTETNRVQLWPEHFDASFDCCRGDRQATFGASPGDAAIDHPYLYVIPSNFGAAPASEVWNATTFDGAVLGIGELVDAADQRAAALTFYRRCRDVLGGGDS